MEHELITVTQAAEILGTSRRTVQYLIDRGDLTALFFPPSYRRQGKKQYLRRVEVEAVKDTWRRRRPRGQN